MEPLATGTFSPFSNWASGIMTACAHSCSDRQHYHRHCGCAFHSIDKRFTGSPSCSPSCTVKVSAGSGSGSGMFRSISVQNIGEKYSHHLSALSEDESVSTFGFSPNGSDLEFASSGSSLSREETEMGTEYAPSVEVLTLVEELASFIHRVKDEHPDPISQRDDEKSANNVEGICAADDTWSFLNPVSYSFPPVNQPAIKNGSGSIQYSTSLIAGARSSPDPELVGVLPPPGSRVGDLPAVLLSCSADIDHLLPRRVSLLEKRFADAEPPQKAKRHVSHRRMRSYGR